MPEWPGALIGGADPVPDHLHHDRRAVILDHHHLQSVVQRETRHLVRQRRGCDKTGPQGPQPDHRIIRILPAQPCLTTRSAAGSIPRHAVVRLIRARRAAGPTASARPGARHFSSSSYWSSS